MFDIGWSELLVIAVVAIVVVGPKDLPRMLRAFGQTMGKIRRMAGEFQSQFNEALREAELEDVKRNIESIRDLNPARQIRDAIDESLRGFEGPVVPAPGSTSAPGEAAASATSPGSAPTAAVNGAPVELPPAPIPPEPPPPAVPMPPAEPVSQALPPQGVPGSLNGAGQAAAEGERRVQP